MCSILYSSYLVLLILDPAIYMYINIINSCSNVYGSGVIPIQCKLASYIFCWQFYVVVYYMNYSIAVDWLSKEDISL